MQPFEIPTTVDEQSWTCLIASLRRLLDEAVARGSSRGVVSAFVETLAVWLEIEVHGYLGDSSGRFHYALSNLGSDPSRVPRDLDADAALKETGVVRLSAYDARRLALTSLPGDVFITRIDAPAHESWLMVFAGPLGGDSVDGRESSLGQSTADNARLLLLTAHEGRLTVLSDLFRGSLNALTPEPIETLAPAPATITERESSREEAAPSDKSERRTAHRPFQAWMERRASQAVQEGGQASVIVISIPDEDVRPEFIQAQVVKIRNDLRPSDFAGSLAGGEIGVLLPDTPADRATAVSARLEKLLQWDVNTGKAIQPSIGLVSCSADSPLEGSILRAARENGAARLQR